MNLGSNPLIPDDNFVRSTVKAAVHVRKHLPLYAVAVAVLLVAVLVPTVTLSGGSGGSGSVAAGTNGAGSGVAGAGGAAGSPAAGASSGGTGGPAGTLGSSGGALSGGSSANVAGGTGSGGGGGFAPGSSGGGSPSQPIGQVHPGTGTTVGGFACAPGVRQIPWTEYAAPCQAAFTGYNGGVTSRGVTGSTILIADRDCPSSANSQAVDQFAQTAGAASPQTILAVNTVFINYFNKAFDLYGRHVVLKSYPVSGGSSQCTNEAESQGQDAACADADGIANGMKAFGEDGEGIYSGGAGGGGSGPFSVCAAQQKLVEFAGGAYFPQTWYDHLNPYVWAGTMGCDRISELVGENLVNSYEGDAVWAGSTLYQHQKRVFGTYVPNNPEYQSCVAVSQSYAKAHGDNPGYTFNYVLDVSRFADQASQAIVQFHAEGVTTVVIACDPISPIFLTEEADAQNYFPEWYEIGTAGNDIDTIPRLWDAKEITGHLFGLSQLGPTVAAGGPNSEPAITYHKLTGKVLPPGSALNYYPLMQLFSQLQAAGPDLTPQTLATGTWRLPEGGAPVAGGTQFAYPVGAACFCTNWQTGLAGEDHTAVEDAREVYWDNDGTSAYDGKKGTYIEIYSGARFKVGEMPTGPPPFYPPQCNPQCTTMPPNQPPPPGPHDGG